MRKVIKPLYFFISVVALILSIAFAVIEGRMLLFGDWTLYNYKAIGFMQTFLRFAFALFCGFSAVCAFFKKLTRYTNYFSLIIFFFAFIAQFFMTNGIGLAIFALAIVYFVINIIYNKEIKNV